MSKVASDDYTSTESESEEEEEENSATEIETDSEFEHDGTTPAHHDVPSILIDDSNITYRRHRRVAEEAKKVQVRTGHILRPINGTVLKAPVIQKQVHGGVKLEFSPLQPDAESGKSASLSNLNAGNNIDNNNTIRTLPVVKPTPLINPRRGDYFLNRTHSTEGIASKTSLELKKKYLLGASGLAGSVKKSGSASTLDSKFKSFVDMISEHQKLLNPAPEPSPTMQAFLQGTSRLHASPAGYPLSPPSPTVLSPPLKLPPSPSQQPALLLRKQKVLPLNGDGFEHVCGLGKREEEVKISDVESHDKMRPVSVTGVNLKLSHGIATSDNVDQCRTPKLSGAEGEEVNASSEQNLPNVNSLENGTVLEVESKLSADIEVMEQQPEEEFDCRPRSPAHETSIVVPEIPWKTVLSDTSCHVSGDDNYDDDDGGDDIVSDSLSSGSSVSDLEGGENEHKNKLSSKGIVHERTPPRVEIHDSSGELMTEASFEERPKTDEFSCGIMKPSETILSQSVDFISSVGSSAEGGNRTTETAASEHKCSSMTSDRSSPSTPPSTRGDDSESYHNEATLAETELSDWAQDADAVVSEDLEDIEFNIDPEYVTVRRHRKPKTIRKSDSELSTSARIARSEDFDFDDDPGHICGINKRIITGKELSQEISSDTPSHLLTNVDNIEFMDTGEEESESDYVLGATNKALLHNSGYIQFVNVIDDEDISTPLVETPTIAHELLSTSTSIPPSLVVSECERDSDSLEAMDVLSQVEAVNKEVLVASAGEDEESSLQPEGTTTEETTTSEIVTVKDSPIDVPQTETSGRDDIFYTPVQEPIKSTDETSVGCVTSDDPTGTVYEEYVRRLQDRISPFSNVRDSIDVRKSRRRNKGVQHHSGTQVLIAEESEGTSPSRFVGTGFSSPGISRKLEAISRERSKQKDLIHEMVMDKLLTQKKSPQEKKSKRHTRGPLNSFTQPQTCQPDTEVTSEGLVGLPKEVPETPGDVKISEIETDEDVVLQSPFVGTKTDSEQHHNVHQNLEVPFADDLTPAGEYTEQFYTPMTSFKKQSKYLQFRQRPLSVHLSFRSGEHATGSVSERNSSCLPKTPLTNPEAFSLPDIRKALFATSFEMLKIPVVPARTRKEETRRAVEREQVREEARIRAQLKTDEELGLSPEDYIKMLRQKVPKRHASDAGINAKRHLILRSLSEPGKELKMDDCCSSSSVQEEPSLCDSKEHSSSTTPAVSRLSPSPVDTSLSAYQQLQTSPSEATSGAASPSSAPLSKVIKEYQVDLH